MIHEALHTTAHGFIARRLARRLSERHVVAPVFPTAATATAREAACRVA